jgi:predicted MFS family arabinose efflux permease
MIGSAIIIVGTVIEIVTEQVGLYMAGRFLIGLGIASVTSAGPAYTVEIAHPQFRGRAGATYNTGWFVGSIPAAIIIFGMYPFRFPISIT